MLITPLLVLSLFQQRTLTGTFLVDGFKLILDLGKAVVTLQQIHGQQLDGQVPLVASGDPELTALVYMGEFELDLDFAVGTDPGTGRIQYERLDALGEDLPAGSQRPLTPTYAKN